MGNYEIYHVFRQGNAWTLPINVSHTSGESRQPALAASDTGDLVAAWTDKTPGYETIYYGTWDGRFWSSKPVPHARGQAPSIATTPDGRAYLAWQDRVPAPSDPAGVLDVFLSELSASVWSLPINVSDRSDAASLSTSVAATNDGTAHVVWIDGGNEVRYAFGRGLQWAAVKTVWTAPAVARAPSIVAEEGYSLVVAWDEGDTVLATSRVPGGSAWPVPSRISNPPGSAKDVFAADQPAQGVAVVWVQAMGAAGSAIFESSQAPSDKLHYLLPLLSNQ